MKNAGQLTAAQALSRLEALCAKAEHSTGELRRKLFQWHIPKSEADRIIASLSERRFVDDRRFARAFVRDKIAFARWGRLKIRAALSAKGVSADIIREALDSIHEKEYVKTLASLIAAKSRTINDADTFEGRTRLFRYAVSRGFEAELVGRIIRSQA